MNVRHAQAVAMLRAGATTADVAEKLGLPRKTVATMLPTLRAVRREERGPLPVRRHCSDSLPLLPARAVGVEDGYRCFALIAWFISTR